MITIPTVLVLGAGASYPYGFPTAKVTPPTAFSDSEKLSGNPANLPSMPFSSGVRTSSPLESLRSPIVFFHLKTSRNFSLRLATAAAIGMNICRSSSMRITRTTLLFSVVV